VKDRFLLRAAYKEQLDMLTMEQRGTLFTAIICYASDEEIPEMDGLVKMCFSFIRQQLDRDNEAYDAKCRKNAENAKKRWDNNDAIACERMQDDANACEPMRTDAKQHARINSHSDSDSDSDTDIKKEPPKGGKKESAPRFHPPSVDEVRAYAIEKGYNVDAERFVDFYTSKGWKVGSAPMKDWKAAVRNWARSERQGQAAKPKNNSNFQSRDIDLDNLLKAGGLYG
jgi:hypothetical protein